MCELTADEMKSSVLTQGVLPIAGSESLCMGMAILI
jgi:hypothetical protein